MLCAWSHWSESVQGAGRGGGCLTEGGGDKFFKMSNRNKVHTRMSNDEQETHVTVGQFDRVNRNILRLYLKESGDAVWHSDGGRLFQDVGPV